MQAKSHILNLVSVSPLRVSISITPVEERDVKGIICFVEPIAKGQGANLLLCRLRVRQNIWDSLWFVRQGHDYTVVLLFIAIILLYYTYKINVASDKSCV